MFKNIDYFISFYNYTFIDEKLQNLVVKIFYFVLATVFLLAQR